MGKVGFTPIIGLAVVVALAMAAVFGAMSLANPAQAAVGQPADGELTERTFSPQDATTTVAQGEALSYDIAPLITGGGPNYDGVVGAITCVPACVSGSPIEAAPTVVPAFGALNLTVAATDVANTGRARVSVVVNLKDSTTNQTITVDVTVSATVNEPSTLLKAIPDQTVTIQTNVGGVTPPASDSASTTIDLNDYFMPGRGTGVIADFDVTTGGASDYTGSPTDIAYSASGSDLELFAPDGTAAALVAVTVEAQDTHGDPNPTYTFFVDLVAPGTGPSAATAGLPSFSPADNGPADVTSYAIKFNVPTGVNTRLEDLLIEFDGDYSLPSSMANTSVAITADNTMALNRAVPPVLMAASGVTFTPENVTVDGEKVFLSLGDMDERDDVHDYLVDGGTVLTVLFRQSAGISNPTEAKGYNLVLIEFGDNKYEYEEDHTGTPNHKYLKASIVRNKISLSEEDGGLGDPVDATGKGFKNGTTLTVFVDRPTNVMWDDDNDDTTPMVLLTFDSRADALAAGRSMYPNNWADYKAAMAAVAAKTRDDLMMNVQVVDTATDKAGVERPLFRVAHPDATVTSPRARVVQGPNGSLELGEDVLCIVAAIGGNDQGKCSFTVTHPTFTMPAASTMSTR